MCEYILGKSSYTKGNLENKSLSHLNPSYLETTVDPIKLLGFDLQERHFHRIQPSKHEWEHNLFSVCPTLRRNLKLFRSLESEVLKKFRMLASNSYKSVFANNTHMPVCIYVLNMCFENCGRKGNGPPSLPQFSPHWVFLEMHQGEKRSGPVTFPDGLMWQNLEANCFDSWP